MGCTYSSLIHGYPLLLAFLSSDMSSSSVYSHGSLRSKPYVIKGKIEPQLRSKIYGILRLVYLHCHSREHQRLTLLGNVNARMIITRVSNQCKELGMDRSATFVAGDITRRHWQSFYQIHSPPQ